MRIGDHVPDGATSVKLLHHQLLSNSIINVCLMRSFLKFLKFCQVALFFPKLYSICWCKLAFIFLLQLIDGGWLDTLRFCQVEIRAHTTLVLNKLHHVLLHKGHAQDIQHLRSLLLILDQEL